MQAKANAEDFAGRFREIISDPLNLLIRRVPNAGSVDGNLAHLQTGMKNFERNGLAGEFIHSAVGKGMFQVDDYLQAQGIPKLDILHADIQGAEVKMLEDCTHNLATRAIDYLLISTHSQALHRGTVALLARAGYRIEVESDFDHGTTSYDGLVFASNPAIKPVFKAFTPLSRGRIAQAQPAALIGYLSTALRSTAARKDSVLNRLLTRASRGRARSD